jgi:integral membrane sensor domain MASE1
VGSICGRKYIYLAVMLHASVSSTIHIQGSSLLLVQSCLVFLSVLRHRFNFYWGGVLSILLAGVHCFSPYSPGSSVLNILFNCLFSFLKGESKVVPVLS